MAQSPLGVGIIGCGNISAAYLRLAELFPSIDMRAVTDIDPNAAQARAEEFGVAARGVSELLASDDIDIVVNLTVPVAHYDVTRGILEAGKHAYSEKPVVLTLEEGTALTELAASKGLRVGSAPDTFLGGAHQQARAMIDAGDIGSVVSGTAHVMSSGMEHWHPNPDFFFKPGAGPVLDVGPYYVANLVQLLGPVKSVVARSATAFAERTILSEPRHGEKVAVETPTTLHAILEFHSGAIITLGASWDVAAHTHGNMELYGTGGAMFLPDPNFFGGTLRHAPWGGDANTVDPWAHVLGVANQGLDGDSPQANYRTAGLAEMAQAISAGTPHRCSLELAVHCVDVMTAILNSAESRETVTLTTTCERPAALDPAAAEALVAS